MKVHWYRREARTFEVKWNEEYGVALSTLIYVLALRPTFLSQTGMIHIRKSVETGERLTQVHTERVIDCSRC